MVRKEIHDRIEKDRGVIAQACEEKYNQSYRQPSRTYSVSIKFVFHKELISCWGESIRPKNEMI